VVELDRSRDQPLGTLPHHIGYGETPYLPVFTDAGEKIPWHTYGYDGPSRWLASACDLVTELHLLLWIFDLIGAHMCLRYLAADSSRTTARCLLGS